MENPFFTIDLTDGTPPPQKKKETMEHSGAWISGLEPRKRTGKEAGAEKQRG